VGEGAARAIVAAREEGGPFEAVWDFVERVDPQVVNKRALEALVKCGALDSTGVSRKGLLADPETLDRLLAWGSRHQADQLSGQGSIFDLGGEAAERPRPTIAAGEYEKKELLALEKESLGLYVSEHPLAAMKDALRRKTDTAIVELERRRDGENVTVGGIVGAIRQMTTKKGEPMVFMRLDDVSGSVEVIVFNSVYVSARELLEADRVLIVKGRIDHKEGETKLIALEVAPFEASPEKREVRLRLDARKAPAGLLRELAELISQYPGEARVLVALETSQGPHTYEFGRRFAVRPEPDFFAEVKSLLGEAAVG
jgi:DNA polymerase-3 subunit alpha